MDQLRPILIFCTRITTLDEQLYVEDPIGYVRQIFDVSSELQKPKTYSRDLIESFCDNIPGEKEKYFSFIIERLSQSDIPVEKEALLYTLGFISSSLKTIQDSHHQIEEFLSKFAFPELSSETGALRARASWVFGEYATFLQNIEFKITVAVKVYENLLVSDLPI